MQPLTEKARSLYQRNTGEYKQSGNRGLIFDRFFDGYDTDFSIGKTADNSQLNQFVGLCGDDIQLADAASRRIQLISNLNGEFGVFSTDWHFVTGMGNSHPVENGFSWHPVLGTPYLPGSSVKGLLRAWMEHWVFAEHQEAERAALIAEWFGTDAGHNNGKAGDLIFFDALPVERPNVGVDIMTPHMGKWYEQGGEKITPDSTPGDWHSPVPVSFLVTKKARFIFSVAPRVASARQQASEAMAQLKKALEWLGAGGKTAAGYGHMSFDESDTLKRFRNAEEHAEQVQAEQKMASMSAEQRIMDAIEQQLQKDEASKRPDPGGPCKGALRSAIDQAADWPKAEREALKALAERVLNFHDGDKWKKKDKAKALYQRIVQLCE